MLYKKECPNCGKKHEAARPHGKFCCKSCRVSFFNRKNRLVELEQKIQNLSCHLNIQNGNIHDLNHQIMKLDCEVEMLQNKSLEISAQQRVGFDQFYKIYVDKMEPLTGKLVAWTAVDIGFTHEQNVIIYKQRLAILQQIFDEIGCNIDTIRRRQYALREGIDVAKAVIQYIEAEISELQQKVETTKSAFKGSGQKHLRKLSSRNSEPAKNDNAESIGAADLLKEKTVSFQLPGSLGSFLGDLERNKLSIALVGDPGAGKSTMLIALAQLFDNARYKTIFFSLELGRSKPLKDMLRRFPVSNQMIIRDSGNLVSIRACAGKFDLVMVDSFGKLGCKIEEWDRLRQDFPKTIFLVIFQKTTSGSSRGGAAVDYDASMKINMTQDKETGKRVAYMEKNRYGTQGWKYYPEDDLLEGK